MWYFWCVIFDGSISGGNGGGGDIVLDTNNPMGFGPSIFPMNNSKQKIL